VRSEVRAPHLNTDTPTPQRLEMGRPRLPRAVLGLALHLSRLRRRLHPHNPHAAVTVIAFPNPFRLTVRRQCRKCSEWVSIDLCNGAEAPREAVYLCCNCHEATEATSERVLALVNPQQELGGDA